MIRLLPIIILLLLFTNKSYSQQFCIGKYYNEINSSALTHPLIYRGKKALYENDSTSVTIYVFNNQGICTEYNRVCKAKNIDSLENNIKHYFYLNTNIILKASVIKLSEGLWEIIIKN